MPVFGSHLLRLLVNTLIFVCLAVCYDLLSMTLHIYPYLPPLSPIVGVLGVMYGTMCDVMSLSVLYNKSKSRGKGGASRDERASPASVRE